MSSLFDLTGKVAIVTGSTKGIGKAIAERMAEHGATVVISSRKADACETVAQAIRDKGGKAVAIPCHVAHKDQLQALVDRTVAECGGIDILVENAGVNPFLGPAASMPDDAYERVMGVNVRSNFWLANMACPHIAARGGGSVIIISSIGGLRGSEQIGVYGISKAAPMRSRPASCAPTSPAHCGKTRCCTRSARATRRCSGSASRTRWPAARCSWPRPRAISSPARRS